MTLTSDERRALAGQIAFYTDGTTRLQAMQQLLGRAPAAPPVSRWARIRRWMAQALVFDATAIRRGGGADSARWA